MIRLTHLVLASALFAGFSLLIGCTSQSKSETAPDASVVRSVPVDTETSIMSIRDVLLSLKAGIVGMSADYPELSGAKDIRVSRNHFKYEHNCRFGGMRGYKETGPNAVAIGLRFMPIQEFRVQVNKIAMQMPAGRWPALEMVGWATLHIGKKPSPGLPEKLNELLSKHGKMIDELDRLAAGSAREFGEASSGRPIARPNAPADADKPRR
jgi:hypothetical protein